MNFSSIKSFFINIANRWVALKPIIKIAIASIALLIPITFFLILFETSAPNYVVLYSPEQMRGNDLSKITSYLDSMQIPYTVNADNLLLVPRGQVQEIRMELAQYGLPKASGDKGYDLFDSTTWIKGEKELQILELRAIKGQLEQDISHFDNVRKANIIIDIPPARSFGGVNYKTKASVILDLVPGARLSQQELRAITYHISGAVRGLAPNMVAISDTSGRLYQGLDYDGAQDSIRSAEIAAEDYIKAKIDGMLSTVLGFDNFYTTVQVSMNRDRVTEERQVYSGSADGAPLGHPVLSSITKSNEQQAKMQDTSLNPSNLLKPQNAAEQSGMHQMEQFSVPMDHIKISSSPGQIRSISIGVLVDDRVLNPEVYNYHGQFITSGRHKEELKRDIESQLSTILKGYKVDFHQAVDFISFERIAKPTVSVETVSAASPISQNNPSNLIAIIIAIIVFGILIMLFRLQRPRNIPSLSERESYIRKAEKKSLVHLEEMLDAIRARYQNNPNSVIGTLQGWMKEDK